MADVEVQVAFQGGGAKFVAMLPIVHAFRDAVDQEIVNVAKVSGTSAGAICAALLAAGADIPLIRNHLINKGSDYLSDLIPIEAKGLMAKKKRKETFGTINMIQHRRILLDIGIKGRPFLRSNALAAFCDDIARLATGKANTQIEQLSIPLVITASNIVQSRGVTHERGNLSAALQDSCSLPILLRSFDDLSESHLVDGGICDNPNK